MSSAPRKKFILAAAIGLLTFVVYLPALRNGFVTWDDDIYVFENFHILSLNAAFIKWAFLEFYASNWHPLTWISHALDYSLWGLNPLGHHLTNNILHAVNTFLVVLFTGKLIESYRDRMVSAISSPFLNQRALLIAAGATGLLFGLHPVHVESVAWVAERKDLLCALFFLLSVISYLIYAGRPATVDRPLPTATKGKRPKLKNRLTSTETDANKKRVSSRHSGLDPESIVKLDSHVRGNDKQGSFTAAFLINKNYIATLVFFILALLSKPMAVSLPLVLLILDWHPLYRIRSMKTLLFMIVEKIPFIALSLGSAVLTMLAQKAGGAMQAMESVPLSVRLPVAAKSLIAYLGKMIWPFDLTPYYMYPHEVSLLSFEYLTAIVLALGITVACIVLAKKRSIWLATWGCYVVTLLPVLGIVQVGIQAMADRYTYLPSLGPFLVLGLATAWLSEKAFSLRERGLLNKVMISAVAVTILGLLSFLTIRQTGVWKDSTTLWGYVIEKAPQEVPFAYMNRAVAHEKSGRLDEAVSDYNRAIAHDPAYSQAYANRGVAFEKAGRLEQAIADYKMAISLDPSSAQTHFNLGSLYLNTGRHSDAIEQYNLAIAINPRHADAYLNRGVALSDTGQPRKALEDYNTAISLNRNNNIAYYNRAALFLEFADMERGRADLQMACDLGYEPGCRALQTLP